MHPLALVSLAAVALPFLAGGCARKKNLNDPLEPADLAEVCAGTPEPRAKAYAKDGPNGHGIVVFSTRADGKKMQDLSPEMLADFAPEKLQDIELVACAVRSAQTKVKTCDYEHDHKVDLFDATYDISIREARTAAVLRTKSVSLAALPCFIVERFEEKTIQSYPNPAFAVTELAQEIVQPREGGAPVPVSPFRSGTLSDSSLDKVCHGIPEKRAAAYVKVPGKVSPTYPISRENDRTSFGLGSGGGFKAWETKDAKGYQLVACITEKSRSKALSCTFDPKNIIQSADYYSATYEVTLREAKTAKVVATKTIVEDGKKNCPTWYPAINDLDHHADIVPLGGPATLAFVTPLIAP